MIKTKRSRYNQHNIVRQETKTRLDNKTNASKINSDREYSIHNTQSHDSLVDKIYLKRRTALEYLQA